MKPKQLAVIGHPVAHSLSPLMHNAALRQLKLPYHYRKIHVLPEALPSFCQKIKQGKLKLAGFNITLPHKEKILPYLDWIAPLAKLTGAVNTVVHHEGRLLGFNTDGLGYVESLREETQLQLKGIHVTLLGAGGAARAISIALAQLGVKHITLTNRTLSRAENLAKHLRRHFPQTHFETNKIEGKKFHQALSHSQLITNTTSVSLTKQAFEENFPDFPWQKLKLNTIISDLVYDPPLTDFLKQAKAQGLKIHPGLGMLVHQGALSFQLWTGHYPDVEVMRSILQKELKKKQTA